MQSERFFEVSRELTKIETVAGRCVARAVQARPRALYSRAPRARI
jgi:hypothetical protein